MQNAVKPGDKAKRVLFRLFDGLVLICVAKTAVWSIVMQRYGEPTDVAAMAWYLLAMGYLGVATLQPQLNSIAQRLPFAPGTVVCCFAAWLVSSGHWGKDLINWDDWLVLAAAFTGSTVFARPGQSDGA